MGIKIEVILGHAESVIGVGAPLVKVDRVEECLEMVDKVSLLLASQDQLNGLERTQPGQLAMARRSEDQVLYRSRVEEGGMVKFIGFGNGEVTQGDGLFEMPKEVEKYPA